MYEMLLIFVFGVLGLGSIFCDGVKIISFYEEAWAMNCHRAKIEFKADKVIKTHCY